MEITTLNTRQLNGKLKEKGYRGWSFEYDSSASRYCLSIFDAHNPEDELVFFLHAFEPTIISHAIRFKKEGTQNPVERKHYFYVIAEEIVSTLI
ncbi:hypothetical protein MZM54_01770 [[Brevibacterium] frigoritolerans]|nr:hypothetical protein [Peribacillus frigoritolerans]